MMWTIIKLEGKKMFRQRWVIPATFVLLLLLWYSFENRSTAVALNKVLSDSTAAYQQTKKQDYLKDLDSATTYHKKYATFSVNPLNPNRYNTLAPQMAIFRFSPMAVLATGQSDLFGEDMLISSPSKEPGLKQEDITNPLFRLFGTLDPAFVLVFLLPLLIIALGYNFISGERENDTLKLLQVQNPSFKKWIWAKLLLQVGYITGVFLPATIWLLWLKGVSITHEAAPLLMTGAALCVYVLFWHLLTLAVNLMYKRSATAATALASCWIVSLFIIPSLINFLATAVYKVPSRVEYISMYRNAYSEAEKQGRQEMLDRYFFDHPELVKPDTANQRYKDNVFAIQTIALYENIRKATMPVIEKYELQKTSSNKMASIMQVLSPSAVFNGILNEAAGVSESHYQHFNKSASSYRLLHLAYIKQKIFNDEDMRKEETVNRKEFSYQSRHSYTGKLLLLIMTIYIAILFVWSRSKMKTILV